MMNQSAEGESFQETRAQRARREFLMRLRRAPRRALCALRRGRSQVKNRL
jgi:hypothetical protein